MPHLVIEESEMETAKHPMEREAHVIAQRSIPLIGAVRLTAAPRP